VINADLAAVAFACDAEKIGANISYAATSDAALEESAGGVDIAPLENRA